MISSNSQLDLPLLLTPLPSRAEVELLPVVNNCIVLGALLFTRTDNAALTLPFHQMEFNLLYDAHQHHHTHPRLVCGLLFSIPTYLPTYL